MFRSIFWKEFREQRLIAAFLPGFAVLIIVVSPLVWQGLQLPAADITSFNQAVLVMFALGCGLVTGAQHWAAEKEAGTLALLDLQPQWRKSFWQAKTAYGVAQWLLQMVVLLLVGTLVSAISTIGQRATWMPLLFVVCWSFTALCWSQMASARTRTPLAAIGWGLLATLVMPWCAALVMQLFMNPGAIALYYGLPRSVIFRGFLTTATLLILPVLPLVISFRTITLPDRQRLQLVDAEAAPIRFPAFRAGWRLAGHDVRGLLWPVGICLLLNVLFLRMEPALLWLLLGTLTGLCLGVSVTGLEQDQGAFKLWADQRLPVGKLWIGKLLNRLMIMVGTTIAAIVLKTLVIYIYWDSSSQSGFVSQYTLARFIAEVTPIHTLIFIGPLTGFAVGLCVSLVARKRIIALTAGGFLSLLLMIGWLPMLGSGGLQLWQWVGLPVAFTVAARFLVWPWASGPLHSRKMSAGVVLPLLFCVLYWYAVEQYRFRSVPTAGVLFEPVELQKEENARRAWSGADPIQEIAKDVARVKGESIWETAQVDLKLHDLTYYQERMAFKLFNDEYKSALKYGWASTTPIFRKTVENAVSAGWVQRLDEFSNIELPDLGPPDDFSETQRQLYYSLRFAGQVLLMDGLRLMAMGDLARSEQQFRHVLYLVRLTGHRAPWDLRSFPEQLEQEAIMAISRWAELLTRKEDKAALARMIALIDAHLARRHTALEGFRSNYYVRLKMLEHPEGYWHDYVDYQAKTVNSIEERLSEGIWFSGIGSAPELRRRKALFDYWAAGYLKSSQVDYPTLHRMNLAAAIKAHPEKMAGVRLNLSTSDWISPKRTDPTPEENLDDWAELSKLLNEDFQLLNTPNFFTRRRLELSCRTELEMLKISLALRGHRLEHGAYPKTLAELSPAWFASVPANPMTLKSFRYELIAGRAVLRADDPFETKAERGLGMLQLPVLENEKILGLVLEPSP